MASTRKTTRMVQRQRRMQAPKPLSRAPIERHSYDSGSSDSEYDDLCCEECGSGDYSAELLLCDKCDRGYHLFCLRPILVSVPKESWFCPSCTEHKKLKGMSMASSLLFFIFFKRISYLRDNVTCIGTQAFYCPIYLTCTWVVMFPIYLLDFMAFFFFLYAIFLFICCTNLYSPCGLI